MMNAETLKHTIEENLRHFDEQPIREAATKLLNTLGYHSQRVGNEDIDSDQFARLLDAAIDTANPSQSLHIDEWHSFCYILQVTDKEINAGVTGQLSLFESESIDNALRRSYMFVALHLSGDTYSRTALANITRFISRQLPLPLMVIFRYGTFLTLAIINRRHHKREANKQVLEKVTLIKDIDLDRPKRAHLDIVSELHLHRLIETEGVRNFDTLHAAWERILSTEALNKRFYRDLEAWSEWAKAECTFPDAAPEMQIIRLITRLLFIWFLREKGLVPAALFEKQPPPLFCVK